MPLILYPLFGVMSSTEVCMSYTQDSQMVFVLSCFLAIAMVTNKLDRCIALRLLKIFGVNPARILTLLMILTFILSALIPNACACSLMIPIGRASLAIFDELGVCKVVEDSNVEEMDEGAPTYPSKVGNAFYIGIGFAANIGGMLTPWSSESGYEYLEKYKESQILTSVAVSAVISIFLLIFTILYLQVIFLKLWHSKREKRITFNDVSHLPDLEVMIQMEKDDGIAGNVMTGFLMLIYICVLIAINVLEQLQYMENRVLIKYSTIVMLICLLAFICPNSCSHLNYFLCREPKQYKMSPSILPWSVIPKLMPWNYFLVYGSSLAYGMGLEKSGLQRYLMDHLVATNNNITLHLMGLMAVTILLSTLGANHLVARVMMVQVMLRQPNTENIYLALAVSLASNLAFVLPISSVSNCFAAGWGNLRSKDM
ncbi:protein I'm not dead yet-like, partial [Musca vetustissima]|uniref:protein I'm not dead yet-like n=1 Tax=Musca vetustissima TaxID=27455 RepID=UPI002AB64CAF